MRITIIGPGAMGTLFAAHFARAGNQVSLLDRDPKRAALLNSRALRIEGISGTWRARVAATTGPSRIPPSDLILICVKTYDTASAAHSAARLRGEAPVLTLQNGLGNVETFSHRLGRRRVIGGTTAQGATLLQPGRIRHAGAGETVLAEPTGRITSRLRAIADVFQAAGMAVSVSDDLRAALWNKVLLNCAINPVGALTRLRNGELWRVAYTRHIMRAAIQEGAAVAAAKRIPLARGAMARRLEAACRATADNINSMLQDILLGRRTEIDAINGAVVRSGRALGVPVAVNAALWRLVKALEAGADRRVTEV